MTSTQAPPLSRSTLRTMLLRIAPPLFALLLLAGCASRDPLDYLPEMPAYIVLNAEQVRSSPAGQKLIDAARKMQPEAAELLQGRLKKIYLGIEPKVRTKSGCGVALGDAGFADYVTGQLRDHGATEKKLSGRKVLTTGSLSVTPIGDSAVLMFSADQDLDKMVRTSQKKNPGARQSGTFKTADALTPDHAFVMATDFSQILSMVGSQLDTVSAMNPKGVETLKQVRVASLTFDWKEQPVGEAVLHLPGQEGRDELAGLINMALGFAKTMRPRGMDAATKSLLTDLKAEPTENGVSVKVEVPKEIADKLLTGTGETSR